MSSETLRGLTVSLFYYSRHCAVVGRSAGRMGEPLCDYMVLVSRLGREVQANKVWHWWEGQGCSSMGWISTSHGVAQAAQPLAFLAVNYLPTYLTKPPRFKPRLHVPTDTQLGASGSQQPLVRSASQTVRGLSRATTARLRLGRLALTGVEGFKSCCAATNHPRPRAGGCCGRSIQNAPPKKRTPTLLCYSSSQPLARQF